MNKISWLNPYNTDGYSIDEMRTLNNRIDAALIDSGYSCDVYPTPDNEFYLKVKALIKKTIDQYNEVQ